MKLLLIVEDDILLNKTLCYNLLSEGYEIQSAHNAVSAIDKIKKYTFDLALFDIRLPDGSGYDLCRDLLTLHPDTPVIFLTANDQESDQLRGYESGAVDYITKPFSILALLRKIKAMFQLLDSRNLSAEIFDDGRLILNFSNQSASLLGNPVALSAMEFKVLYLFQKNPKHVLTRSQLLDKLWDTEEKYVDEHTLTATISRIRSKIEADGTCYIKTIYGMGYLWTGGDTQ